MSLDPGVLGLESEGGARYKNQLLEIIDGMVDVSGVAALRHLLQNLPIVFSPFFWNREDGTHAGFGKSLTNHGKIWVAFRGLARVEAGSRCKMSRRGAQASPATVTCPP